MVEQVSIKNTKAQILAAYERLCAEHEQLQARHEQSLQEIDALKGKGGLEHQAGAITPPVADLKPAPKRAPPETGPTIGTILDELATLRAGLGGALNDLSSQLSAEVTTLVALRQQMHEKKTRLEELHGIAATENALDGLIQAYEEESRAVEDQLTQKRQAFEQNMAQKREGWAREQKAHSLAIKDREERLKTERQREAQEYKYNLELERKLDTERYEQEKQARYRELEASVTAKEKIWAERENAIAEQEQICRDLKTEVESLAKTLEAAIRQADKESTEVARKEAKIRDDLLAKEEEGNRRIAELKIQSLQSTIDKQAQQITSLSAQIDAIVKQSQSLAIKAIEGASHETSFQSIREIALEQAKRPPKSQ